MMRWRDTRTPYDVTVAGLTSKGSAVFYGVDCPMINKPTFYPRYLYLLFYWLKGQGINTYTYNISLDLILFNLYSNTCTADSDCNDIPNTKCLREEKPDILPGKEFCTTFCFAPTLGSFSLD